MRLFAGDDWAEDHHDVEVMDETGRVLARKRLPEGAAGMGRLHELIGQHLGQDAEDAEGDETVAEDSAADQDAEPDDETAESSEDDEPDDGQPEDAS